MRIKSNIAVSESGYVFNPSTGESFSVNPIGIEIFNLIKEGDSFEEISGKILSDYITEKDTFEKDYSDFIALLRQFQLLENGDE
jgi:hypothetical protein